MASKNVHAHAQAQAAVMELLAHNRADDVIQEVKEAKAAYDHKIQQAKLLDMQSTMDQLMDQLDGMSLRLIKGELHKAFERKKGRKPVNAYTSFVRENLPIMRANYPQLPHKEHMCMVGKHWNIKKVSDKEAHNKVTA